jgi:hypothetical protein
VTGTIPNYKPVIERLYMKGGRKLRVVMVEMEEICDFKET